MCDLVDIHLSLYNYNYVLHTMLLTSSRKNNSHNKNIKADYDAWSVIVAQWGRKPELDKPTSYKVDTK